LKRSRNVVFKRLGGGGKWLNFGLDLFSNWKSNISRSRRGDSSKSWSQSLLGLKIQRLGLVLEVTTGAVIIKASPNCNPNPTMP
jgi:hypothetical protein